MFLRHVTKHFYYSKIRCCSLFFLEFFFLPHMCVFLQQKPSFELSGKLASETNRVRGEAQISD